MNHKEWIKNQFTGKMMKVNYRNALIHFSLIESFLRNKAQKRTFDLANKTLLCCGLTTSEEFCIFEKIRLLRNEIIHKLFLESLGEKDINKKVNNLMKDILFAYKKSEFLKKNLIEKYEIKL